MQRTFCGSWVLRGDNPFTAMTGKTRMCHPEDAFRKSTWNIHCPIKASVTNCLRLFEGPERTPGGTWSKTTKSGVGTGTSTCYWRGRLTASCGDIVPHSSVCAERQMYLVQQNKGLRKDVPLREKCAVGGYYRNSRIKSACRVITHQPLHA